MARRLCFVSPLNHRTTIFFGSKSYKWEQCKRCIDAYRNNCNYSKLSTDVYRERCTLFIRQHSLLPLSSLDRFSNRSFPPFPRARKLSSFLRSLPFYNPHFFLCISRRVIMKNRYDTSIR